MLLKTFCKVIFYRTNFLRQDSGELLTLGLLVLARGSPADAGLVLVQVEVAYQALGPPTQLHHLGPGLHAAHAFLHCGEKTREMQRVSWGYE